MRFTIKEVVLRNQNSLITVFHYLVTSIDITLGLTNILLA